MSKPSVARRPRACTLPFWPLGRCESCGELEALYFYADIWECAICVECHREPVFW